MDSGFAWGAGGGLAHLLLWVALAVAALIAGAGVVSGRRLPVPGTKSASPLANVLALVLPILGYLVTLPTHAPFAAGHGLGVGFLLGGVAAWLLQVIDRPAEGDDTSSRISPAALAAAALSVGAVLQFVPRSSVLDALMGCAMGWLVAGALRYLGTREGNGVAAVGVAVALATAALLGVLRDGRATQTVPHGTWSSAAVLLVAVAALFVWLAGRIGTAPTPGNRPSPFVAAIPLGLTALAALVLAYKGVSEMRLFALAVAGLLIWPVASRLLRLKEASHAPVLMSALLVVSGFLVGGQVMQGYGAALVIVMLWVGAACLGTVGAAELRVLLFATTLALFRAFAGRWGGEFVRSDAPSLGDQYALFGLVVGLAAPAVAAAVAGRAGRGKGGVIGAAVAVGLLSLVFPLAALTLFGAKCALGIVAGGGLALLLTGTGRDIVAAGLTTLAMGVALDQWAGRLVTALDLTRLHRLEVFGVLLVVTIILVAVTTLGSPRVAFVAATDSPEGEA